MTTISANESACGLNFVRIGPINAPLIVLVHAIGLDLTYRRAVSRRYDRADASDRKARLGALDGTARRRSLSRVHHNCCPHARARGTRRFQRALSRPTCSNRLGGAAAAGRRHHFLSVLHRALSGNVDGGAIGQRHHGANTGGRYQAPAHLIVPHDGQQTTMQDDELLAKYNGSCVKYRARSFSMAMAFDCSSLRWVSSMRSF